MNRTRGRSISQAQDDVVTNIDSHLDFVKRVLKWSISDLDRFITLLRARIAAEEAYIISLSKLTRTTEPTETTPLFGEKQPSFLCATFYYEQSIEHTIQQRRDLIQGIRIELDKLILVKEGQEGRRKIVKQVQGEKNANYAAFRTGELVKLKKAYSKKCNDLQVAQQQFEQQQQQQQQQQQYLQQPSYDDINLINDYLPPQHSRRRSYDESKRLSNDSLGDNDASSIHSLTHQDSAYKKGMANFMASMAQVRTQFANVSTGTTDLNKQNTKYAKYKKEIMDADHEYRSGIRQLERLRKQQISGAIQAMKHLEIAIIDKAEVTQSTLCGILDKEHLALVNEIKVNKRNELCQRYAIEINAEKDFAAFNNQYRKLPFKTPEPLRYENHYLGPCKYILFGGSLMEYHAEHDRTVPVLVTKCVDAIDSMGLQKEGIYRISGRQSNVENLKHAFEQDEGMDIDRRYDVFTIATVLKIYLRQLEEPLLKIDMTTRVKYTELKDKQRQLMYLQTILSGLSKPHRDTLLTVIRHLAKVNANSHVNKMTLQNLSVIFTPAIFHDFNQAEHPGEWHMDTVFEDLITYYDALFTNAEIQSRANAGPQPPITINTTATATDYPPSSAASTNLLLTAAMGPPPMAMIANDDSPPTPANNRSASLAALTRSGTLQPSRSQGSSLQQVSKTNDTHQLYYQPSSELPALQKQQSLYQYQHTQLQQQQHQNQQSSYHQPPQHQSNYQHPQQSSYHPVQQQQQPLNYQLSQRQQQQQQTTNQSNHQEHSSTTTSSHATRTGYTTYIPKLQMQNLTISTDKWQTSYDGEKTIEEGNDGTTPTGSGTGDNQLRSPLVDDLRDGNGGGSKKYTPPRQDSLRTIKGGSANSSTSSLAAAVTHTANMVAAGGNSGAPPSTKSRVSPSAPQHPHMAQPVVIAAQQHFPSSAQIVPTYSSPVTPDPSDATN